MLTLFRFLSRCPLWILHGAGWLVGWASFVFSVSYCKRFRANVTQAGVAASASQEAIGHAGRMLLELPYLWMRPSGSADLLQLNWEGEALVEAAHAKGKGLVLMTPHMGCFEVSFILSP